MRNGSCSPLGPTSPAGCRSSVNATYGRSSPSMPALQRTTPSQPSAPPAPVRRIRRRSPPRSGSSAVQSSAASSTNASEPCRSPDQGQWPSSGTPQASPGAAHGDGTSAGRVEPYRIKQDQSPRSAGQPIRPPQHMPVLCRAGHAQFILWARGVGTAEVVPPARRVRSTQLILRACGIRAAEVVPAARRVGSTQFILWAGIGTAQRIPCFLSRFRPAHVTCHPDLPRLRMNITHDIVACHSAAVPSPSGHGSTGQAQAAGFHGPAMAQCCPITCQALHRGVPAAWVQQGPGGPACRPSRLRHQAGRD